MLRKRKKHVLLLEVLIAFALVALCIFPLIAPHVFILKAQYQFNNKIALDQTASRIYTDILQKVYRNEIPWQAIEQKQKIAIGQESLSSLDEDFKNTYNGFYQFSIARRKGDAQKPFSANVVSLSILFEPKEANQASDKNEKKHLSINYNYRFFAAHLHENPEPSPDEKTTPIRNPA